MPNYSLVIDATYDPLTLQEIATPINEAAAYHQSLQDSYDKMQLASAMYAPYVKDDPVAKEMFDRYMSNLQSGADVLMNNGAWGQRDTLSRVRKSYGDDMLPIELGYKKREAEAQIQQQGKLKGLEFSRDARTSPISYYFDHPEGGYEIADPAVLTNMVATQMKAYAEQLRSLNPEQQAIFAAQTGLPESMIATVAQYGIPAEAAINWRNYDFMRAIMRTALGSKGLTMDDNGYGVANDTWSKESTDRLINSMSSGFAAGAGKDVVNITQDPEYMYRKQAEIKQMEAGSIDAAQGFQFNQVPGMSYSTINDPTILKENRNATEAIEKKYAAYFNYGHIKNPDGSLSDKDLFYMSSGKTRMPESGYQFVSTSSSSTFGGHLLMSKNSFMNEANKRYRSMDKTKMNYAEGEILSPSYQWNKFVQDMTAIPGVTYDAQGGVLRVNGQPATLEAIEDRLNDWHNSQLPSRHHMMSTTMDKGNLNGNFRGLSGYRVQTFDKNGNYKKEKGSVFDKDIKPVSMSNVIANAEDVHVSFDTYRGKEGIMVQAVDKDNKTTLYHIPWNEIPEVSTVRMNFSGYVDAERALKRAQRQYKLSDAEVQNIVSDGGKSFLSYAPVGSPEYARRYKIVGDLATAYNNLSAAYISLLGTIGITQKVPDVNMMPYAGNYAKTPE
jgi:hypothetical protein